jgi:hypothetical protein
MTPFSQLRMKMDADVNYHVGDSISVTLHDNSTHMLTAFVTVAADGTGIEGMNPIRRLAHVKLDKTPHNLLVLPHGPADIKRLVTPVIAGTFKPAADSIDDNDNAWLFDLQKARPL